MKSPEALFTPARQEGESGLLLLRKTFQLWSPEEPFALNGHRGDTKLRGKVVLLSGPLRFQEHKKECRLSLAGYGQLSRNNTSASPRHPTTCQRLRKVLATATYSSPSD